jgi:hypothetical protein
LYLPCTAHGFFPELLSNRCLDLHHTFLDAVPLSDPSRNRIRPDTRLQIKGRKESARATNCAKCCTLAPKICNTIIYRSIALLLLLHRRQHQSRKL